MATPNDEGLSPESLDGVAAVRTSVEQMIHREASAHEYLTAADLDIITMYVVGSIGAGEGRKGSDLDLIVALRYAGDLDEDAQYDWLEYVQHDIEPKLKRSRSTLAEPLARYVGYVDPKLGDTVDATQFVREMTQHGEYDRVYDVYDGAFIDADRV